MLTGDNELLKQVAKDYKKAQISDKEKLMLFYAVKLTNEPSSIKERDVEALKKVGFSDREIFDINQVISYFNYVNRIADGLGVDLEDSYKK